VLAAADNDGGKAGRGHMLTLTVKSNAMRIRDVNESRETRDAKTQIVFSVLGKEFLEFRESRAVKNNIGRSSLVAIDRIPFYNLNTYCISA